MNVPDIVSSAGFESVFRSNFEALYTYAVHLTGDEEQSREIVQNVFYKLWQKREDLDVASVAAYLNRAVYNGCMDHFRHMEVRKKHMRHAAAQSLQAATSEERTSLRELEHKLDAVIQSLPAQCRLVFHMSRFEELRYQEIADRLGISVKAVEKQIMRALKTLRTELKEYLPLFAFLLLYL